VLASVFFWLGSASSSMDLNDLVICVCVVGDCPSFSVAVLVLVTKATNYAYLLAALCNTISVIWLP
jgi:hypothetical protein